jgi:hypothetical protein
MVQKTNKSIKKLSFLTILIVFSVILTSPASGFSQSEGWGLGVILGEPTGISFKTWLNKNQAIDAAAAWSFGGNDAFHIHGDYLFHNRTLLKFDRSTIPLYYGIGARLRFQDDNKFGVRFPLGVTFFIREAPIDVFLELVPILNLAPATEFDLNGAIGARYYF